MRIGDWSSDVCTSDLLQERGDEEADRQEEADQQGGDDEADEPQKLMLWGRLGRILADEFVVEARRVRSLGLPRHMVEQGRGHQQRDRSERHRQDAAEELQVHREGEDEDREGGDKPEEYDLDRPERNMGHVRQSGEEQGKGKVWKDGWM